jgi:digeranylgeranylglycerophospholipid reductase
MNTAYDIIVIGAGPVGSYTACLLAKEGFHVGIFEKNSYIGKHINCTGIISVECFQKFNLPSDTITRPIHAIKAISPSGNFLRYQAALPLAYIVNRTMFDREMNSRAEKAGAVTHLNSGVKEIAVTRDAFSIKTGKSGEEKTYSSKIGIIATGFELHELPGIPKRPGEFFFGAQTEASMEELDDVEVYFGEKIAPGSFSWVVPVNETIAKIGLLTRNNAGAYLKKFLASDHISGRLNLSETPIKSSPVPTRTIPKSYADRLVVVGEAAGQVKATTGGGIYFGLLCSEIAVHAISKAFRQGDFTGKTLGAYDKAWRSELDPELKAGMRLRNVYSMLSDRQIDFLIDIARKDGIMPVIQRSSFDWHKDIISHVLRHLMPKNFFRK